MKLPDRTALMTPLWRGDTVYAESVLLVQREGELPEAPLLYTPERVISVCDAHGVAEYREGVDWVVEGRTLKLLPGTAARFVRHETLFPASPGETPGTTCERAGGGWLLLLGTTPDGSGDYRYFHDRQLAITYTHRERWPGPVPGFALDRLPRTAERLRSRKPLTWLLLGDSIAEGYSASGHPRLNAPPYLPSWGELTAGLLRQHYGAPVRLVNRAVAGKSSAWARETISALLGSERPELIAIAFGMNDGTGKVAPDVFREQIAAVMEAIRRVSPGAEFILVSPMLPNREAALGAGGTHALLKPALASLARQEGVILADVTAVSETLLERKRYADVSGNHFNHPNDFMVRVYAHVLGELLVGEGRGDLA